MPTNKKEYYFLAFDLSRSRADNSKCRKLQTAPTATYQNPAYSYRPTNNGNVNF